MSTNHESGNETAAKKKGRIPSLDSLKSFPPLQTSSSIPVKKPVVVRSIPNVSGITPKETKENLSEEPQKQPAKNRKKKVDAVTNKGVEQVPNVSSSQNGDDNPMDDSGAKREEKRLAKKAFYKKKKKERAQRKKAKLVAATAAATATSQEGCTEEKQQHQPMVIEKKPVFHLRQKQDIVDCAAIPMKECDLKVEHDETIHDNPKNSRDNQHDSVDITKEPEKPLTKKELMKSMMRFKKKRTRLGELIEFDDDGCLKQNEKSKKKKQKEMAQARSNRGKKKEMVMTFPMFDEDGNRIVLIGKQVKANNVVFRRARKRGITSLKKAVLQARIRSIISKQKGSSDEQGFIKAVDEFLTVSRTMSPKERKERVASLPPLQCHWGDCKSTFGNSKAALAQFRDHLEAHARKQAQDDFLICQWEGCSHEAFMKPRALRIHAKSHAKSQLPPKPHVWTEERVKDLKAAVPRDDPFDVWNLDIKHSDELDKAADVLLTELGRLQTQAKQSSSSMKDRIVIGLRQTHRDIVTGNPKLILLAKRIESSEGKGTPLDEVKEIVSIANRRKIPIAAVLSRRKIAKALKPWAFQGKGKGFGVSAVLIIRETGANQQFSSFMEILETTLLPSQQMSQNQDPSQHCSFASPSSLSCSSCSFVDSSSGSTANE